MEYVHHILQWKIRFQQTPKVSRMRENVGLALQTLVQYSSGVVQTFCVGWLHQEIGTARNNNPSNAADLDK